ncbi:hypothetical protein [Halobacillus litoralis]|uniref:hypothetical protein n=1 Tax=Halobacillus litoralis TaxID=45668 RepID=UPI001CD73646|nr:hypothetical protein [Halobacillus litoralis]MCA1020849.1 hypothetical protein [Halobacillus litoralis]
MKSLFDFKEFPRNGAPYAPGGKKEKRFLYKLRDTLIQGVFIHETITLYLLNYIIITEDLNLQKPVYNVNGLWYI